MKKIALAFVALALFASSAFAATLTKKTYRTPQAAAKAGAAYAFNKGMGYGRYHTSDMRILKALDTKPPTMKFKVQTSNGIRTKVMTVKKMAPGKYKAFLPNRHVATPWNVGR